MCKLTILFLLFYHLGIAQQFNFSNIGTDRGLPSSEVYYALQDSRGYLWFSTNSGVCRYNGKEFTTYTTAQGLTDNTVLTMCEDRKGRIWFGPQNNEICYWQNDTIHTIPAGNSLSKTLAYGGAYLLGMYADSNDDIWLSTSHGLFVSESKQKYSTIHRTMNNDSCNTLLKSIDEKKSTIATQGDGKTLHFYDIGFDTPAGVKYFKLEKAAFLSGPRISRTVLMDNGSILFSMGDLLYIIFPDGKVDMKQFDHSIITLNADKDKGLWIGFFKGGLAYYKNQDLNSLPIRCLEKYSISSICKDDEGGVWATTIEHGLFYAPSTSVQIYPDIPELEDRVAFLGALDNKIIISTLARKFIEISRTSGFHLTTSAELMKMGSSFGKLNVLKIINDSLYFGFDLGLIISDRFLKRIKTYNVYAKDLVEGDDHRIWAINGGEIIRVDKHDPQRSGSYSASFRLTSAIAEKDSGLYVGSKSGLYLFKNGKYSSLAPVDSLLKNQVIQMKKDIHGNIWLATIGAGVLVLKDNKVIKRIDTKQGLISDICNAIEIDQYGNVWVGAPNGLSCIKKGTETVTDFVIQNLSSRNGLNNNEITTLYADDNKLWIGTIYGMSSVDISGITISPPSVRVYLKSVEVNNTPMDKTDSLFISQHNNVRFTLEGLTFSYTTDHRYRYRLKGFDSTWKETRSEIIEYNNLPPGAYTFSGQVANAYGVWSKIPVRYDFSICEPFWKRWWFILLEIAALAFSVQLFINFRTRIITKREEEKTRINKLLAEYQMRALRAQMNPHFIFNAINSIQTFILLKDSAHAYEYLTKFSSLIRSVLIGTKENEMTLKQEIEILSLYVELEQLRFEDAFEYIFHIDEKINTDAVVIPALLIQPYVENAIWHGLMPLKDRKGVLDISIRTDMKKLFIVIKDNGLGRERSSQIRKKIMHQSMGMDLNNKRVELFAQGSGDAAIVVKDIYDNEGKPAGTSVEITLPMVESY